MNKHLSIVVVLLILISVFSGMQGVYASENIELTYPGNGEYINYDNGVTVKGSIASGYESGSAKIYIDGVLKKTLSDNITTIDDVITSDGISALDFGKHKITLEAIYSGQKVSSTKEFILTGVYDKAISDPMAGKGREDSFSSGIDYSFSNNSYYAFSNSNGSVSFTRKSEATTNRAAAYFSLGNNYVLNSGKFIFKTILTVSDPSHSITLVSDRIGASIFENTLLVSDGKFLSTDKVCESDVAYEIEVIYDLDNNTKTYKIDEEIIGETISVSNPISQIRTFSVNWYGGAAAEGAKITFDNLQLFHVRRLPLIDSLEYNLNNETTVPQNEWENGYFNYNAKSVTVVMDEAVDETPGVLLRKSGSEVAATVLLSSDKTKLTITPDDGFEPGFTYNITLSDVVCDKFTYTKNISESFDTQSHADVTFLINGESLRSANQIGENDVISVRIDEITLPDGITDATYILSVRRGLELVAMTGKTLSNIDNWSDGFEISLPPIAENGQYEVYLMVLDSYQGCNSVTKYMSIK